MKEPSPLTSLRSRRTVNTSILGAAFGLIAAPAIAQLNVEIRATSAKQYGIAIPPFGGRFGAVVDSYDVLLNDLESTGLVKLLSPAKYPSRLPEIDQTPRFSDWRRGGNDGLLVVDVDLIDGVLTAQYQFWDTLRGRTLIKGTISEAEENSRKLGHLIGDDIYKTITGDNGYFNSRIAFVEKVGRGVNSRKNLIVMDQDGENLRRLSQKSPITVTPHFNSSGSILTYVSFIQGVSQIYLLNIVRNVRRQEIKLAGHNFSPRFMVDDTGLLFTNLNNGQANIVNYDFRTKEYFGLTDGPSIDTGAFPSPDGKNMVFESDRNGVKQLFIANMDGSNVRLLTKNGGSYTSASWSPRNDLIAFTKVTGGNFQIGVISPSGTGERILASGFHNEAPCWSPNGRVIMFFREDKGRGTLWSVDVTGTNLREIKLGQSASDPDWSPSLT